MPFAELLYLLLVISSVVFRNAFLTKHFFERDCINIIGLGK